MGWVSEVIYFLAADGVFQNRGVLYGPWLPIYGVGALGIYAMKPAKKYPLLLFLLCAVVTGVVEYVIGYIGIYCFDMRLWDYRGLILNLDGIICLRSVLTFAVMGMVFHYWLEPAAERLAAKIPTKVIRITCLLMLLVLGTDCVLSVLYRTPITY